MRLNPNIHTHTFTQPQNNSTRRRRSLGLTIGHHYAMSCGRLTFLRCGFLITRMLWHWLTHFFVSFFSASHLQAQFVLCIFHTIRAMLTKDCSFPKFISALLLLNASIFFVLFMNFYIQNYKKRRTHEQSIANEAAKASAGLTTTPAIEAKKVNWGGEGVSSDQSGHRKTIHN